VEISIIQLSHNDFDRLAWIYL